MAIKTASETKIRIKDKNRYYVKRYPPLPGSIRARAGSGFRNIGYVRVGPALSSI